MHSLEASGSVPTFILKLWKLVGEDSNNDLICWNRNGRSFSIKDQSRFAKEVLPLYFKHNNMASFIRQLNMYGFRKVSNIDHGGLKSDADEVEFFHHSFLQEQDNQLQFIKRKMPTTKSLTSIVKVDDFHEIISDVEMIKGRQDSVDSMLSSMKQENEALWREVAMLRQKHMKQQQIVEKLLHFLVSIVRKQVVGGIKRKTPLMIDSSLGNNRKIAKATKDMCVASPGANGPIISDITDLDENELTLQSLQADPSQQFIGTLPISLETEDSSLLNPSIDSSLLNTSVDSSLLSPIPESTDEENANFGQNPLAMISLPNSLLDFDLDAVQQAADEVTASELLNDQISSGLSTPKITMEESMLSNNLTEVQSDKQALDNIKNESESTFSTDLIVPEQTSSTSSDVSPLLTSEYLTFNDHLEGIDAELNWLQDQLYGGGLSIDPTNILGFESLDNQEPSK